MVTCTILGQFQRGLTCGTRIKGNASSDCEQHHPAHQRPGWGKVQVPFSVSDRISLPPSVCPRQAPFLPSFNVKSTLAFSQELPGAQHGNGTTKALHSSD